MIRNFIRLLNAKKLIEIYDYYDCPRLFSLEGKLNNIFIILSVDKNEEGDKWLCTEISQKTFILLKNKELFLYRAFLEPDSENLKMITSYFDGSYRLEDNYKDVPEKYLPDKDMYLY